LLANAASGEEPASDCASGKPAEARIRACSAIIDVKPSAADARAQAYRIRAAAYSEKANHKQAIADFTEALALKGDDATAYFGRGESRLADGDASGAVADLTQAIRYSEPTPRLFIARGYVTRSPTTTVATSTKPAATSRPPLPISAARSRSIRLLSAPRMA
jgi:tetratricopeptide (TPR) repeat protein